MPVAEPSGEYTMACAVDLSPIYGRIEEQKDVTLTRPPGHILDQRLEELEAESADVRRTAAYDLAYFKNNGARVFPALLSHLEDPDESVRSAAFSAMRRYEDQIRKHIHVYLEILNSKKETDYWRRTAAYLVSSHAPLNKDVEQALVAVKEAYKDHSYAATFKYYLDRYQKRLKEEIQE